MITCYVAGASAEMERARAAIAALRGAGIRVYDWTEHHRPTADLTPEECREAATTDADEITEADIVLVLAPSVRSDALVEMGIAIGAAMFTSTPVVVAGTQVQRGIFGALCNEEHERDEDAIGSVIAWAREVA